MVQQCQGLRLHQPAGGRRCFRAFLSHLAEPLHELVVVSLITWISAQEFPLMPGEPVAIHESSFLCLFCS